MDCPCRPSFSRPRAKAKGVYYRDTEGEREGGREGKGRNEASLSNYPRFFPADKEGNYAHSIVMETEFLRSSSKLSSVGQVGHLTYQSPTTNLEIFGQIPLCP